MTIWTAQLQHIAEWHCLEPHDHGGSMKLILNPPAMTAVCPVCGSDVLQFLGNESSTGKSWYKCLAHPPTQQVFSLKLPEPPRFGFEARA